MMDKYQWTSIGMSVSPAENGPMRYVREVDYDALETKVMGLSDSVFQYGIENSKLQLRRDALEIRLEALEAWKEEMRDAFATAVQADLEHGVQWMNEEACKTFSKKYPNLCKALSLLEQDDDEDEHSM